MNNGNASVINLPIKMYYMLWHFNWAANVQWATSDRGFIRRLPGNLVLRRNLL